MTSNKTIAWQKYEDYIEKQLSSPVLSNILQNVASLHNNGSNLDEEDEEDEEDYIDVIDDAAKIMPIPLTNQLVEDLSMLSSFDCWIGHTNFDITIETKNILDTIPGIEVLKVLSRYRFFIGIGQLFDFKDVRKYIEQELI